MRLAGRLRWPPLLLVPLVTACDGIQSMTGGDGYQGRQFVNLFTLFMVVTGIAYALVIVGLIAAVIRRGQRQDGPDAGEDPGQPLMRAGLFGWIGFILVGLTLLIVTSYWTDRDAAAAVSGRQTLDIEITGNQWWWKVRYNDPTPSNTVITANELHLPVGIPAKITLKSNDVIHSLWVPNLSGKQDLIPGRQTDLMLIPTKTGYYRGQCAEYCGAQHAHMAIDVTVESRAQFEAWRAHQLASAPPPSNPLTQAGYNYVTTRECSVCHNIAGTPATGNVGPDLTHVASRSNIGAGTLPMRPGHLYGWVADPQGVKPGNRMPTIGLNGDELHAVVAYLETLK